MNVLIIGGGGREHALAWKLAQSPRVAKVFVAPGNAGTAHEAKVANIAIPAEEIASLVEFARSEAIALTVVGPEVPLALGIVDAFSKAGRRVVIEEFLSGEVASFIIVASDGDFLALESSQDHKRVFDGDTGPNTGGMGAYSPAPVVTAAVRARVIDEVIRPTLAGLQR